MYSILFLNILIQFHRGKGWRVEKLECTGWLQSLNLQIPYIYPYFETLNSIGLGATQNLGRVPLLGKNFPHTTHTDLNLYLPFSCHWRILNLLIFTNIYLWKSLDTAGNPILIVIEPSLGDCFCFHYLVSKFIWNVSTEFKGGNRRASKFRSQSELVKA